VYVGGATPPGEVSPTPTKNQQTKVGKLNLPFFKDIIGAVDGLTSFCAYLGWFEVRAHVDLYTCPLAGNVSSAATQRPLSSATPPNPALKAVPLSSAPNTN